MHKLDSGIVSATRYGGIVFGPRPRTFGMTPAIFAEQDSENASNGHFFRQVDWYCSGYSMHNCESGMCSVIEYGSIELGPRLRTFGVTPAIFAEQDSEHA
jgi:hypothetical protein